MVTAIRRSLRLVGILALLASVPCSAFSQPAFKAPTRDEQQAQILDKIQKEQSENGPHSEALIDPLTALGQLYEQRGEHALAVAAFERAQGIVRNNYGLRSLDQAPLIWQMLRGEEARGHVATVWYLEQELLDLTRQNPDDPRIVPILHEMADRRMEFLRQYDVGETLSIRVVLGCYYSPGPTMPGAAKNCYSGDKDVATRAMVEEAQALYVTAINVLLKQGLATSDEVRELEMQLVRGSYQYGPPMVGRASLGRLLAYETADPEPRLSKIDALIQLADWDLVYGSNDSAFQMYKLAYRELERTGVSKAEIEQRFSPTIPIALPAFLPSPMATEDAGKSIVHIDATFEITANGTSKRVAILDTTNATREAGQRFTQMILRRKFRPVMTNGEFAKRDSVAVRYFFNGTEPALRAAVMLPAHPRK